VTHHHTPSDRDGLSPAKDRPDIAETRVGAIIVDGAQWAMFGHAATPVHLLVVPRGSGWRFLRAASRMGIAFVVAIPLALIPPHTVWSIGALITGMVLARNRWLENHTIVSLEVTCPRCQATTNVRSGVRLRRPHPVECSACRHTGRVDISPGILPMPA